MTYKLLGRKDTGHEVLIDPESLNVANVVLNNVPCDATVYIGAAVRMESGGSAVNAIADSEVNSNVVGIVEAKADTELCNIRVLGVSLPVFTGLDVSKEYYLSGTVAGSLVTIPPITSGHYRLKLGQPFSATEFLVSKGERTLRA